MSQIYLTVEKGNKKFYIQLDKIKDLKVKEDKISFTDEGIGYKIESDSIKVEYHIPPSFGEVHIFAMSQSVTIYIDYNKRN